MNSSVMKNPQDMLNDRKLLIDNIVKNLEKSVSLELKNKKISLVKYMTALDTLSPLKTLVRGYSIVENDQGKVIKSVKQIKIDEEINITLNDGKLKTKVIEINN